VQAIVGLVARCIVCVVGIPVVRVAESLRTHLARRQSLRSLSHSIAPDVEGPVHAPVVMDADGLAQPIDRIVEILGAVFGLDRVRSSEHAARVLGTRAVAVGEIHQRIGRLRGGDCCQLQPIVVGKAFDGAVAQGAACRFPGSIVGEIVRDGRSGRLVHDRQNAAVAASATGGVIHVHDAAARIGHLRQVTFDVIDVARRECARNAGQRSLLLLQAVGVRNVRIRDRSQAVRHLRAAAGRVVLK